MSKPLDRGIGYNSQFAILLAIHNNHQANKTRFVYVSSFINNLFAMYIFTFVTVYSHTLHITQHVCHIQPCVHIKSWWRASVTVMQVKLHIIGALASYAVRK